LDEICHTIKLLYPKYQLNPENYAAYIDYMKNDKKIIQAELIVFYYRQLASAALIVIVRKKI